MAKGWIKLHRKIMDSDFWLDGTPFDKRSAWIDLLLLANREDKGEYKAGRVYKSKKELARRWHWSEGKVTRFLNGAQNEARIRAINRAQNGTVVIIENWALYQIGGAQNGAQNGACDDSINSNHLKKNKKYKASEGGLNAPSLASLDGDISSDSKKGEVVDYVYDEEKDRWAVRIK